MNSPIPAILPRTTAEAPKTSKKDTNTAAMVSPGLSKKSGERERTETTLAPISEGDGRKEEVNVTEVTPSSSKHLTTGVNVSDVTFETERSSAREEMMTSHSASTEETSKTRTLNMTSDSKPESIKTKSHEDLDGKRGDADTSKSRDSRSSHVREPPNEPADATPITTATNVVRRAMVLESLQRARSTLDHSGRLTSPGDTAYLPNVTDSSFISEQLEHEKDRATLTLFEWEGDDAWLPLEDDGSIPEANEDQIPVITKWVSRITSHSLDIDTYMTQIRCLADEVLMSVKWCRIQVERIATSTYEDGVSKTDPGSVDQGAIEELDRHHYSYRNLKKLQILRIAHGTKIVPFIEKETPTTSLAEFIVDVLHDAGITAGTPDELFKEYVNGFGQELRWDTLGKYRTVAAGATQRSLHARDQLLGIPQRYHELEHHAHNGQTEALKNWAVAWAPIALSDAIHTIHGIATKPTRAFDVAKVMTMSTLRRVLPQMWKKICAVPDSQRYLPTAMETGYHKSLVSADTRIYDRTEPLQFPHLEPPPGSTHCEGRYVRLASDKHVRWVSYPDDDYYVIPTNVATEPRHWVGRTIPGEPAPVAHFDDVLKLFTKHRVTEDLPFPPGQPFVTDWTVDARKDYINFDELSLATDRTPLRTGTYYPKTSTEQQPPSRLSSPEFSGTSVSPLSVAEDGSKRSVTWGDNNTRTLPYEPVKSSPMVKAPQPVDPHALFPGATTNKSKVSVMHRGVPLQFPDLLPSVGQSHMSGRYIQLPEERI